MASGTSKEMELKLTGVARVNLARLLTRVSASRDS
jgi:hypothetical protein